MLMVTLRHLGLGERTLGHREEETLCKPMRVLVVNFLVLHSDIKLRTFLLDP